MKRLGKSCARPFVGARCEKFSNRQGSTAFPKFRRRFHWPSFAFGPVKRLFIHYLYIGAENASRRGGTRKPASRRKKFTLRSAKPLFSSNLTQNARALAFRSKQGRGRKSYATVKVGSSAIRATRSFRRRSGFPSRPRRRAGSCRSAFSRSECRPNRSCRPFPERSEPNRRRNRS